MSDSPLVERDYACSSASKQSTAITHRAIYKLPGSNNNVNSKNAAVNYVYPDCGPAAAANAAVDQNNIVNLSAPAVGSALGLDWDSWDDGGGGSSGIR